MTPAKLRILDRQTEILDQPARLVEGLVLPKAARDTPKEFENRVHRLVVAHGPRAVAAARAAAVRARYVLVHAEPAGTGTRFATGIPAPLARACDAAGSTSPIRPATHLDEDTLQPRRNRPVRRAA